MPKPKRPRVASPEEVKITRDGDFAIIEYADPKIATTRFQLGKEKLASMTDDDILLVWNQGIEATDEFIRTSDLPTIEIPVGKPQVKYESRADQWVPRGHVIRCVVVNDSPQDMEDDFISIDERDFTVSEFVRMVGTFGGWGMRIEFVHDEEVHERPEIEIREPDPDD